MISSRRKEELSDDAVNLIYMLLIPCFKVKLAVARIQYGLLASPLFLVYASGTHSVPLELKATLN